MRNEDLAPRIQKASDMESASYDYILTKVRASRGQPELTQNRFFWLAVVILATALLLAVYFARQPFPASSTANAAAAEPMTIVGIYVHGFFLSLAVGLPYVVLPLEAVGIVRKDKQYSQAARRISVVWAISFGFGAVTGTLVEFGLVQIWSGVLLAIGSFFFIPLVFELFAFLTEIVFLSLYLYTWGRMKNQWLHWLLGFLLLIGSSCSAVLILTANSWMQTPWGTGSLVQAILPWSPVMGPSAVNATALIAIYQTLPKTGSLVMASPNVISSLGYLLYDPYVVLLNPNAIVTAAHTILTTIVIAAFETAAIFSYSYLTATPRNKSFFLKTVKFSYGVGALGTILTIISGDQMARIVYSFQYLKFLSMEGFRGGVDPIIGLISNFNPNYTFPSFNDLASTASKSIDPLTATLTISRAEEMTPILSTLYYSMIISGILLLILSIAYMGLFSQRIDQLVRMVTRISTETFVVYSSFVGAVLGIVAGSAGWAVRELGRQPWTIYGLIRPEQIITPNPITPLFSYFIILVELMTFVSGIVALYFIPTRSLLGIEAQVEVVRG
jgi:cytochrome d ubiquinol oxidase subunit I